MIRAQAHQPRHAAPRSLLAWIAGTVAAEVAWLNGGRLPTRREAVQFVAVSAAAGFVGYCGVVMFLIVTGPR